MLLSEILKKLNLSLNQQYQDFAVSDIVLDSRLAKENSIFFVLPSISGKNDAAKYTKSAIANGAKFIFCSENDEILEEKIPIIKIQNPKKLLVEFLKVFYYPLPANIYAVTGTNGKTSVAEFFRQILEILGKKSASIGTLGVRSSLEMQGLQDVGLTTPDIVSLYKNLAILKAHKIDDVVIEASSIGLEQGRVAGIEFCAAAFTNFTQDHLDYHKNMEEYFLSKMILFENLLQDQASAILNSDIAEFEKIAKICLTKNRKIISYGKKSQNFKLLEVKQDKGLQKVWFEFVGKKYEMDLSVLGEFQAYNMLCALGLVNSKYDLNDAKLKEILPKFREIKAANGRMEKVIELKNGAQIFIDFAHSPDALENILKFARKLTKARVLVLFGCGGDRDSKKRPIMGKIACDLADLAIITDDNPRTENADKIRDEILQNCDNDKAIEIAGRKDAIKKAIELLKDDDLLIIAGKGHEDYQIIGTEKLSFDEKEIVLNFLKNFN